MINLYPMTTSLIIFWQKCYTSIWPTSADDLCRSTTRLWFDIDLIWTKILTSILIFWSLSNIHQFVLALHSRRSCIKTFKKIDHNLKNYLFLEFSIIDLLCTLKRNPFIPTVHKVYFYNNFSSYCVMTTSSSHVNNTQHFRSTTATIIRAGH